jgi:hypothetical protein
MIRGEIYSSGVIVVWLDYQKYGDAYSILEETFLQRM